MRERSLGKSSDKNPRILQAVHSLSSVSFITVIVRVLKYLLLASFIFKFRYTRNSSISDAGRFRVPT